MVLCVIVPKLMLPIMRRPILSQWMVLRVTVQIANATDTAVLILVLAGWFSV